MLNKIKDKRQQAKIAAGIVSKKPITGPWTVQIDLINACNNDCIACWCHSPLLGKKAMKPEIKKKSISYKRAIELIDELDELGVRDIYFTGGGEPFMHPKILDIMRYIKKKGMKLDMSTNFTLVTKKIADELIKIGINHMNLSLWAATPETYSKTHPNKSNKDFERMVKIIDYLEKRKKELGKNRPEIGTYNVISKDNYFEVENMLEFAYKHRIHDVDFTPADIIPNATECIQINKKERKELIKTLNKFPALIGKFSTKYNHHIEIRNYETFLRRIVNEDSEKANYDSDILCELKSCYAGWTFARVLATGEVNSCLKSFKKPIGNINDNSFKEIWYGAKQKKFRKHTIDYNPKDSYFNYIGNDIETKNQGCIKCCDNLGFNMLVNDKMNSIGKVRRKLIKLGRFL